ncbi:unnamed protein product [Musa acuminata subsp. malaccensis]|uniref:(wild Malaysian banana) hypothetical protein n=1 Tax=Musa acuminata subsp. malaccensis TaxID=214687 RepID=A0A804KKL1_MUSAM|nr:PREDICTED: probable WRKY transcription factor 70 [Musa acuminata subsp. malaccensis]CAG1835452.1 unnamed protein product [Musa acuminata subsp. malaccensis]
MDRKLLASDRTVVEVMSRIRKSAVQLGVLLREEVAGDSTVGVVFAELTSSISRVFDVLESMETVEGGQRLDAGLLSPPPPPPPHHHQISTKKRKIYPATDRREGCRRRSHLPSKIVGSKTLNDGQTWRKYGQKEIQSSKNPRSYFRCTHKFDQGCMAVRQVQRSEEDPSTYLITYLGEHTCRDPAMAPQLFSTSDVNNTCLLSFGASRHRAEKEAQVPASPFTSRKQESDEEGLSNLTTACSSPDYFVIPAAEKPAVMTATSGFLADLYFEDVFGFDHDGFLS